MTADTNKPEPMQGLAEYLLFTSRHFCKDPRDREQLRRWAAEVEASRLPLAGAATSDEPKCPRCGLPQAECDFQKNFPDPDAFDGDPAAPLPVQGQEALLNGAMKLLAWANDLDYEAKEEGYGGGSGTARRIRAELANPVAALRASSAPTTKG